MRVTLRRGLPNTLGLQTLGIRRCLSALDFFFFASPDEEGADVVAVFYNLFKFLSNEEDDDDVEAEAEAEAESLSLAAIVAFSLSSFVATTTCPWTKDDCYSGKNAS